MAKQKEKTVNISGKLKHSLDVNRDANRSKNGRSSAIVRRLKMYNIQPKRNIKGTRFVVQGVAVGSDSSGSPMVWKHPCCKSERASIFPRGTSKPFSSNYNVLLKERKIPMSILNDLQKQARVQLDSPSRQEFTFSTQSLLLRPLDLRQRGRSLLKRVDGSQDAFEEKYGARASVKGTEDGFIDLVRHTMFEKGQSKRIRGELYKVI